MMAKDGGKYVYEGSYGCAFKPALPCVKTGLRKGLGKVFGNVADFKQEEKLQKFVKKIDSKHEATIPYYGSCRVDIDKTRKSDQLSKCEIANEYSDKSALNQIMFKYGGDDLDMIMNGMNKSNSEKKLYNKYKDLHFDTIIKLVLPVLKCIVKIAKYGYLHSDIKPPNLLYNAQSNKLYLIDFGLLQKQRYISQSGSTLSFKYLYYPPEFITMMNLRSGVRDPDRLYKDVLENFEYYDYEHFVNKLDYADYERGVKDFINYAISTPLDVFEKDFVKSYIKKLDVYSLGMSLVEMMHVTQSDNTFKVSNTVLYDSFMKNVLIHMIHPDPRKRLTPDEAYIRVNCLYRLEKIKVKEGDIVNFLNKQTLKQMVRSLGLQQSNDKNVLYKTIVKNANLLIK